MYVFKYCQYNLLFLISLPFSFTIIIFMYDMLFVFVAQLYDQNSRQTTSNDSVPPMRRRGSVLNIISGFFIQLLVHYSWVFQLFIHLVPCLQAHQWSTNIWAVVIKFVPVAMFFSTISPFWSSLHNSTLNWYWLFLPANKGSGSCFRGRFGDH